MFSWKRMGLAAVAEAPGRGGKWEAGSRHGRRECFVLALRMWQCVMTSRRESGQSLSGSKEMAFPLLRKVNETFQGNGNKIRPFSTLCLVPPM